MYSLWNHKWHPSHCVQFNSLCDNRQTPGTGGGLQLEIDVVACTTLQHPKEKKAYWALDMFSVMALDGLRSEVHQMPWHFEAVVAVRVAEPTSAWAFSGTLPCECRTSSHFWAFIWRKFFVRKSWTAVAWMFVCTCVIRRKKGWPHVWPSKGGSARSRQRSSFRENATYFRPLLSAEYRTAFSEQTDAPEVRSYLTDRQTHTDKNNYKVQSSKFKVQSLMHLGPTMAWQKIKQSYWIKYLAYKNISVLPQVRELMTQSGSIIGVWQWTKWWKYETLSAVSGSHRRHFDWKLGLVRVR